MKKGILKQAWPSIFACLAFIAIGFGISFTSGCAGTQVQVNNDPAVVNVVIQESASSLAYFGLRKQNDEAIADFETCLQAVQDALSGPSVDVEKIFMGLAMRLNAEGLLDRDYVFLAEKSMNLLSAIVKVDLAVPENHARAVAGVKAFIAGAQEGIGALRKSRVAQKAA